MSTLPLTPNLIAAPALRNTRTGDRRENEYVRETASMRPAGSFTHFEFFNGTIAKQHVPAKRHDTPNGNSPLNRTGCVVNENALSRHIIDAALEVHRSLGGPGLLEHIYEEALAAELVRRGFSVRRQVPVTVTYKGEILPTPLRLDLLVNDLVIVESKAVSKLIPAFVAQTASYMQFTRVRLALLINFGQKPLRQGIRRVVKNMPDA